MTSTVRFTEEMLGHVTFGESDFARGAEPDARRRRGAQVPPHDRGARTSSASAPTRCAPAGAVGYLAATRSAASCPVERGWFNLFVDTEPGVKHMLYRLWFRDGVGHPLTLTGFKLVERRRGLRRLEGHDDALHARAARPRGGGRRRRRRARGLRRAAHPRARLRQAADDVPGRRARASARSSARWSSSAGSSSASSPRPTCARGGATMSTRKDKRLKAASRGGAQQAVRPHAPARRPRRRRRAHRVRRRGRRASGGSGMLPRSRQEHVRGRAPRQADRGGDDAARGLRGQPHARELAVQHARLVHGRPSASRARSRGRSARRAASARSRTSWSARATSTTSSPAASSRSPRAAWRSAPRATKLDKYLAFPFGVGVALVLDESALLLELDDVYWTEEGVLSVQIVVRRDRDAVRAGLPDPDAAPQRGPGLRDRLGAGRQGVGRPAGPPRGLGVPGIGL